MSITPIGITDWRNERKRFGIKDQDRLGHIYCIGKTGTGKSTLLLTMAISDIEVGNGLCIIDPHGDIAETVLNHIPKERMQDVIYFNATDSEYSIAFNPLHGIKKGEFNLVAASLISTFKKIWADSWGPRLEHILRFSILTLLHYPRATLLDIQSLLTDPFFRTKILNHVSDHLILSFWKNEFEKFPPQLRSEAIAPILNKTGLLIASLPLRTIVGQQERSFSMQEVMDGRKILICNLSKGMIGEDASSLLGAMILTTMQTAALSRASYPQERRIPFYLYVDEMHSFVTLSFADILAEARKYGLALFLTHQYIEQLSDEIRSAIFGNVGTLISFRVGATDAEYLAREFYPIFKEDDFVNLPKFSMYLKLMIDGATSKPFSATTFPLSEHSFTYKDSIVAYSRNTYGKEYAVIEQELVSKYRDHYKQDQGTLFS